MMKILKNSFIALITIFVNTFVFAGQSSAAIISVSSDGNYAITSNYNNNAYLWNLKDKIYKKLNNEPINTYSANFILNTTDYILQNSETKQVTISDAESGKVIKSFNPGFIAYGETATSNLKLYIASDEKNNIYAIDLNTNKKTRLLTSWCYQDHQGEPAPPKPYECTSFRMAGKLNSLNISPDNKYLVSTDNTNLFIWNLETLSYIKGFSKNVEQTFNAISPNGDYLITADQQKLGIKYSFDNKKVSNQAFYFAKPSKSVGFFDDNYNSLSTLTSFGFIDDDTLLATFRGSPKYFMWVAVFHANKFDWDEPKPTFYTNEYLPLIKDPNVEYPSSQGLYPQTRSFMPVVATSPEAHILVMAQANGSGIMVYKFNPDDQTLKLIWSPEL